MAAIASKSETAIAVWRISASLLDEMTVAIPVSALADLAVWLQTPLGTGARGPLFSPYQRDVSEVPC